MMCNYGITEVSLEEICVCRGNDLKFAPERKLKFPGKLSFVQMESTSHLHFHTNYAGYSLLVGRDLSFRHPCTRHGESSTPD